MRRIVRLRNEQHAQTLTVGNPGCGRASRKPLGRNPQLTPVEVHVHTRMDAGAKRDVTEPAAKANVLRTVELRPAHPGQ